MWEVKVKRGENGFSMTSEEEIDEGVKKEVSKFFQETYLRDETFEPELKDVTDEQYAFTKLVYELADFFDLGYNKFEKNNLQITWDKRGHKI